VKLRIAWQSLVHNKVRAFVAIAGITFAIHLIFIQLGLYDAVLRTATLIQDRLDYDIVLVPSNYVFLAKTGSFPRRRIAQARAVPGVERAVPLYVGLKPWRNEASRQHWRMFILAFDPDDRVFRHPEIEAQLAALRQPDTVLLDRQTRPEFGSQEEGTVTELGHRKVRVVGQYTMGFGFLAFGAVLMSDQSFSRSFDGYPLQDVHLGLVKLKPDAGLSESANALRVALGPDVRVLTRAEQGVWEKEYWATQSSVGLINGFGAIVAVIVGIVILYQVLATDITNALPQFAMLKAIGYTNSSLAKIVLLKVCILGMLAYVPAVPAALAAYGVTRAEAKLPIVMTLGRLLVVLLLTLVMSAATGLFCMRKLKTADPADLY
jgi:putative ABC transport system permease protein